MISLKELKEEKLIEIEIYYKLKKVYLASLLEWIFIIICFYLICNFVDKFTLFFYS